MIDAVYADTYTGQVPLPEWYNKIQIMREFGWTERQLLEEVTIGMLNRIAYVLNEEGKKMKREAKRRSA